MSSSINTKKKEMEKKKEKSCLYLKNGEEVYVGDIFIRGDKFYVACEEDIPILIENEILYTEKPSDKKEVNISENDLAFYVGKIAQRLGWRHEKAAGYLNNLDSIYPAAAFTIVLREIAIELDKKYEDHISNSPEIYSISPTDGRITRLYKNSIRSYKNFAAFRTIDDAKFACKVLREVLKDMFKGSK